MKKGTLIALSVLTLFVCLPSVLTAAILESRYFYHGDGKINLVGKKTGATFRGVYRNADGTYNEAAMKRIYRTFGAVYGDPVSAISPRFIEFLDFIEDRLNPGAGITIHSGFRSPKYNMKLRENGSLAAKASLHQYGMAADIKITGVASERVWNFVKELGFGGAGFYHGALVHVDVGLSRSWDETTSGVFTDISDDNKLIAITTDRDIYLTGETIEMRFIKMTAFPIGVNPEFIIEKEDGDGRWKPVQTFTPTFRSMKDGTCPKFFDIGEMLGIKWTLPKDIAAGRYRVRASFCERQWEAMPSDVATLEFEIR